MAAPPPGPSILAWRQRIEFFIRLASPGLDLLLAAGDRVSRVAAPETPAYLPPAPGGALPARTGTQQTED